MDSLPFVFGILLASSWINMMLYMLEIVLVIYYFFHFGSDSRIYQYTVIASIFFDTVCTMAVCGNVVLYLIIFAQNPPTHQLWTLPVTIIASAASAMVEQSFLIFRFWNLSKNPAITIFLGLLVTVHAGFALLSGVYISIHPQFEPNLAVTATTVANCLSAATDILIALALVWQLRRVRSSFHSTRSLIKRLSINAISSGFAVALMTLLMMVLFLIKSVTFSIFSSSLGRFYSLTILVSLCSRKSKKSGSTSIHMTSDMTDSIGLASIHVHRSTLVRMDEITTREKDLYTINEKDNVPTQVSGDNGPSSEDPFSP